MNNILEVDEYGNDKLDLINQTLENSGNASKNGNELHKKINSLTSGTEPLFNQFT